MIVFLDIDGVMVHANPHRPVELDADGFYKFNDVAVKILQSTIYFTKDQIVLSSSHRYRYSIAEWKEIFGRRGLNFKFLSILDIVRRGPKVQDSVGQSDRISRKAEIFGWIAANKVSEQDVVIIDDDKSLNDLPKELKERLVLTNPYNGLIEQSQLHQVLKRRVKRKL